MSSLTSLHVAGVASGGQAASADAHFLRLLEFTAAMSGKAALSHAHAVADVAGFAAAVIALIESHAPIALALSSGGGLQMVGDGLRADSGISRVGHAHVPASITGFESAVIALIAAHAPSGAVTLSPSGGLELAVDGLRADSGISRAGHAHAVASISDFAAGVALYLSACLLNSTTVAWDTVGVQTRAAVRLKAGGALAVDADGLSVQVGSTSGQVAAGDHTHALLHAALTLATSASLDLALSAQQLTAEVRLKSGGGLVKTSAGVECEFGSSATQVASGNHTHAALHDAVTVLSSTGVTLALSGQQITASVRVDAAPASGRGKVGVAAAGVFVELGAAADQSAPGNHGHSAATASVPGFMSSADKVALDAVVARVNSGVRQCAAFTREAELLTGKYLLGSYFWPMPVAIYEVQIVAARSQTSATLLTLEIAGTLTAYTLTLPAGTLGTEATATANLGGVIVTAGQRVRWKVTSAPATGSSATMASLSMDTRS